MLIMPHKETTHFGPGRFTKTYIHTFKKVWLYSANSIYYQWSSWTHAQDKRRLGKSDLIKIWRKTLKTFYPFFSSTYTHLNACTYDSAMLWCWEKNILYLNELVKTRRKVHKIYKIRILLSFPQTKSWSSWLSYHLL